MNRASCNILPSPGIYYLVRFPNEWKLLVYRYADGSEFDHVDFWRKKVAFQLAVHWRQHLGRPVMELERLLRDWTYAFPRGRVSQLKTGFVVLHGNDLADSMRITRPHIETAFGIRGKARWQEDGHEHCLLEDKEEARELLHLKENWPHRDVSHEFDAD